MIKRNLIKEQKNKSWSYSLIGLSIEESFGLNSTNRIHN